MDSRFRRQENTAQGEWFITQSFEGLGFRFRVNT